MLVKLISIHQNHDELAVHPTFDLLLVFADNTSACALVARCKANLQILNLLGVKAAHDLQFFTFVQAHHDIRHLFEQVLIDLARFVELGLLCRVALFAPFELRLRAEATFELSFLSLANVVSLVGSH